MAADEISTTEPPCQIEPTHLTIRVGKSIERIPARTVLWGAGVRASALGRTIAASTGVGTDSSGRVPVEPDLTLPGHPEVFVIGDMAACRDRADELLPGVAPVAIQRANTWRK